MSVELTKHLTSVEPLGESQLNLTKEQATRKANGYLTKEVSMFFGAEEAVYLPLERPIWQVSIIFLRYSVGPVRLGFLDVDAATGQVDSLTQEQIQELRKRANAFIKYHTLQAAA